MKILPHGYSYLIMIVFLDSYPVYGKFNVRHRHLAFCSTVDSHRETKCAYA